MMPGNIIRNRDFLKRISPHFAFALINNESDAANTANIRNGRSQEMRFVAGGLAPN
jgi:hypothetical protein